MFSFLLLLGTRVINVIRICKCKVAISTQKHGGELKIRAFSSAWTPAKGSLSFPFKKRNMRFPHLKTRKESGVTKFVPLHVITHILTRGAFVWSLPPQALLLALLVP